MWNAYTIHRVWHEKGNLTLHWQCYTYHHIEYIHQKRGHNEITRMLSECHFEIPETLNYKTKKMKDKDWLILKQKLL